MSFVSSPLIPKEEVSTYVASVCYCCRLQSNRISINIFRKYITRNNETHDKRITKTQFDPRRPRSLSYFRKTTEVGRSTRVVCQFYLTELWRLPICPIITFQASHNCVFVCGCLRKQRVSLKWHDSIANSGCLIQIHSAKSTAFICSEGYGVMLIK